MSTKKDMIEKLIELSHELQENKMDAAVLTVQDAIRFIQNADNHMVNVEEIIKKIRTQKFGVHDTSEKQDLSVYLHPYTYAVEHDEVDEYRGSLQLNELCAKEIDLAIQKYYDISNWCLKKECIFSVLRKFSYERICWVLAYYIQKHEADGRISIENRAWAKTYSFPEKNAFDGNIHLSSHVGLVNVFTDCIRKRNEQTQRLLSDLKEYFEYSELDDLLIEYAAGRTEKTYLELLEWLYKTVESDVIPKERKIYILELIADLENVLRPYSA